MRFSHGLRFSQDDRVLVVAAGAAVALLLARFFLGCVPAERVAYNAENVAAVVQYERLLDECKEKARRAKDYVVFEKCADDVDRMLCTVNAAFCNDGGLYGR